MPHRPSAQQMGGLSRSGEADERRRERAKDSPRGGEDRASRRPKQPERRPGGGRGGGERGKGEGETRADGPTLLHDGPRGPPKCPENAPREPPRRVPTADIVVSKKPPGAPPNLDVMYLYVTLARSRFLPSQPPGRPKSLPRSPQDGPKEPPKGFQTGLRPSERNPTRPKRAGRRPKRAPTEAPDSPRAPQGNP